MKRWHQQELRFRTRGGTRLRAGRKRMEGRGRVAHRAPTVHKKAHPVHVTLRAGRKLPSLRKQLVSANAGGAPPHRPIVVSGRPLLGADRSRSLARGSRRQGRARARHHGARDTPRACRQPRGIEARGCWPIGTTPSPSNPEGSALRHRLCLDELEEARARCQRFRPVLLGALFRGMDTPIHLRVLQSLTMPCNPPQLGC